VEVKAQVRQNPAILGELTPELKHVKELALESTGVLIFAGTSQEVEYHSLQLYLF
jgi:hypothetical protein